MLLILNIEKKASQGKVLESLTKEELNKRIDQSESDFRDNHFKSSSELLAKYKE